MKWILIILMSTLVGCSTWHYIPNEEGGSFWKDTVSSFDPRIPYRGQYSIYDPNAHDYDPDRWYKDQNAGFNLPSHWYGKPTITEKMQMQFMQGSRKRWVLDPVTKKWRKPRNRIEAYNGIR